MFTLSRSTADNVKLRIIVKIPRRHFRSNYAHLQSVFFWFSVKMKEEKRFEQFFFDTDTIARIMSLAGHFTRPLFLCMPSLAERYEKSGLLCHLYDRDRRFSFLKSYHYFDLFEPYFVEHEFDAIFLDPPFSNINLAQLSHAVNTLNGFQQTRNVFICHVSEKGRALISAFTGYSMCRFPGHLTYRSVKPGTQRKIFLFGPESFLKYDSGKS